MAKVLRDLLDASEPLFSTALRQLERASGSDGVDARLIGDISAKVHRIMRQLGLDPSNCTGEELYHGLLSQVARDNARLARIIGAQSTDDVNELVPLMITAANAVRFDRSVFVLKHESAKRLLRQMPPYTLMRHLGYDDIEAMLDGEPFAELYTALRFSEGAEWLDAYDTLFENVTPDDYETRDIEIVRMNHEKYVDLARHFTEKKLHNVTHTKELGAIVVVPLATDKSKGLVLKTLPLLLHYLNEIKLYSTFFKLQIAKPHFGKIVVETLIADPSSVSLTDSNHVHWRVLQRYFGKLSGESHPEAFEPHVHPEDLHWRHAESLLTEIDPAMELWLEMDYVAKLYEDGRPVTANMIDVSLSYANDVTYTERYVYHFRESLWNEIFMRYMSRPTLEQQILRQLDNDLIEPETIRRTR